MSDEKDQGNRLCRLIDLLEYRVGTPSTGYYGSVRVDEKLTQLLSTARAELQDLLKFKERLEWLHTGSGVTDQDGYEWGVARLKFDQHGQLRVALWTNSDHSDLDAEMARTLNAQTSDA